MLIYSLVPTCFRDSSRVSRSGHVRPDRRYVDKTQPIPDEATARVFLLYCASGALLMFLCKTAFCDFSDARGLCHTAGVVRACVPVRVDRRCVVIATT